MKKIAVVLALGVAFCLVLCSAAEAISNNWAKNNLKNKNRAARIPIWQITQDGSRNSVNWVNHTPNPRFAVYDVNGDNAEGSDYYVEDLVLDTETGLVWARDANYGSTRTWQSAIEYCARYVNLGNRKGWRAPYNRRNNEPDEPQSTRQ